MDTHGLMPFLTLYRCEQNLNLKDSLRQIFNNEISFKEKDIKEFLGKFSAINFKMQHTSLLREIDKNLLTEKENIDNIFEALNFATSNVDNNKKLIFMAKVGNNINSKKGNWDFSKKKVVDNFNNHILKSVPLYNEGHNLIINLSEFFEKKLNLL